ncbi:phosphatidylinositol glycan, class M, glycosyltransferase family 50 protein [Pseudohyphozyma bogoriensis]|nr:phosphatidylinositol glycan, class M, glycosyltransferase family 50 protein [Pseudohyphozyma bogoriensis]
MSSSTTSKGDTPAPQPTPFSTQPASRLSFPVALSLAALLRLVLILWSFYQDAHSPVKYTDIDHSVFTDAARCLLDPSSPSCTPASGPLAASVERVLGRAVGDPYARDTYRYTPLLALVVSPNIFLHPAFAKTLFSVSDLLVGLILHSLLRSDTTLSAQSATNYVASIWLLNPLIANISTRGSSESVLGVLVVSVLWFAKKGRWGATAVVFGLAVHFKVFPFAGVSFGSFMVLNGVCYAIWGYPFLTHTYLYHIHRLDHRHNFSPYFYSMYLSSSASPASLTTSLLTTIIRHPLASFAPQLSLSVGLGFLFGKQDLAFAWFVQTFAFVAFNKVCTSQYFLWYLWLLPPVLPRLNFGRTKGITVISLWVLAQATWLSQAFRLEMKAQPTFTMRPRKLRAGSTSGERDLEPSEYSKKRVGVLDLWEFKPKELYPRPSYSLLNPFAPFVATLRAWRTTLLSLSAQVKLLTRFVLDMTRLTSGKFWAITALRTLMSFKKTACSYLTTSMIAVAGSPISGRPLPTQKLLSLLGGYALVGLVADRVSRLADGLEEAVRSSIRLETKSQLLRIHCQLSDEQLQDPQIQSKIEASGDLMLSFSPFVYLEVCTRLVSILSQSALLCSSFNATNAPFLAVDGCLSLISIFRFNSWRRPPAFYDVANDAYLRLESILSIGTWPRYRREVEALNLKEYLLIKKLRELLDIRCYFDVVQLCEEAAEKQVQARAAMANKVEEVQKNVPLKIEFKNVSLSYDSAKEFALQNVSFTVEPGEIVSIVGHNRSGKTTLFSLLSKINPVTSGEILLNGIKLEDLPDADLRQRANFAFQSSPSLPLTIKEFVALGSINDRHDDELIKNALRSSGAHEVATSLPEGWNSYPTSYEGSFQMRDGYGGYTAMRPRIVPCRPAVPRIMEENFGSDESQDKEKNEVDETKMGNKNGNANGLAVDGTIEESDVDEEQKAKDDDAALEPTLTDARYLPALLDIPTTSTSKFSLSYPSHALHERILSGGQPRTELLCFDEPAAALDPAAEAALFDTIFGLRGTSTILFSTHRFSVTPRADKILVFSHGKLVEQGTHASLMKIEGGEYKRMWELQAEGFVRTEDGEDEDSEGDYGGSVRNELFEEAISFCKPAAF